MTNNFNYNNTDTIMKGGSKKVVRKVSIKNGKGYKSITRYHRGKKISYVKKPIHPTHIMHIKSRKFIPGFFSDCNGRDKNKTCKHK